MSRGTRETRTGGGEYATAQWSSPLAFVAAAAGAVIGFNNFWQFPWLMAQHGGGAFLLVYVLCVGLLGLPLLVAEILLGKTGRRSPVGSFALLARRLRADPTWTAAGAICVLASFLILSYLSVIAAWTLAYVPRAAFGLFAGQTADGIASLFAALVRDPEKQLFWFTLFIIGTMTVSARGVRAGLEPFALRALSALLVLTGLLLAYGLATPWLAGPGAPPLTATLASLLAPDFTRFGVAGLLAALAHAFFSLGLGVGVVMMYAAYAPPHTSVGRAAMWIAGLDTAVGVAAGLIVGTILAAGGIDPEEGPALAFQALPLALDHLFFGGLATFLFYVALVLAAWLSAVAFAEPAVAWLTEQYSLARSRAALAVGLGTWALGFVMMLSFDRWAFSFTFFDAVKKFGAFDIAQIATSHFLLPLAGLATALFAGWVMKAESSREALELRSACSFDAWLWLTRLVAPALLIVLLFALPGLLA